jgi:hypothetical protein
LPAETPKLWVWLNWTGNQAQTSGQGVYKVLPNVVHAIQAFFRGRISNAEAL